MALAYLSERQTKAVLAEGKEYKVYKDPFFIALVVMLVLFTGLRTAYNDTYNYIRMFYDAPTVAEFISDPDNLNIFKNPLYYIFQDSIKELTGNAQHLIFISSLYTQICFLTFFKKYSKHFAQSIFIFVTLGTLAFTLAALKQVVAMATLTIAFRFLEKKKWGWYFVFVFIAMLFHTYALAFVLLPLFMQRPWKWFTYIFVFFMVVLLMNFEEAITSFMDQAEEVGKVIADYEVFEDTTTNVMRLAVYAVVPFISLVFQKWIFHDSTRTENLLAHMSIISLAFMSMGTQSGANMFGRMANYFELGTICILPTMIERTFEKKTARIITVIAALCFLGFFAYANAINSSFDAGYRATSIFSLFKFS